MWAWKFSHISPRDAVVYVPGVRPQAVSLSWAWAPAFEQAGKRARPAESPAGRAAAEDQRTRVVRR
eukprot:11234962-Alexandrium_andersonii.AAC.1